MAPPPLYLSFSMLLLLFHYFLHSALLASSSSDSLSLISTNPQIHLGRRYLLAKSVEDEDQDDEKLPPMPKKKKAPKSDNDDEEEEEVITLRKKNKSSSSKDEDEELPKKKKKSTSSPKEKDEEEDVSPKKKKVVEDEEASLKKKKTEKDATLIKPKVSSSKNQSKLIKPSSSSKNTTKLVKPIGDSSSSKNKTKLVKTSSSLSKDADESATSSKSKSPSFAQNKLKKLNSTSIKSPTSTKSSTNAKSSDLIKSKTGSSAKNTTKLTKSKSTQSKDTATIKKKAPPSPASWIYGDGVGDDLVEEFRNLPTKFQKTFIPDLHRISTTSKIYLSKANKEMTKGFKPYVGNKYAPSVATAICFAFVIVPLLLVSLIFNKIKAYFSLQRLLIFIQIYLAIYFSILCLSSLLTGLEPLRFFYATSQSTYIWLQVLQTLGYVFYLLLLLMYLILVFSTETTLGQKFLGLAQTLVGLAVGLHYYMTVFHRVVLRQPPKTNWKVHGIYATCFLLICLLARAERRKKAYLEEGGEEGKKS